ncbi:MAG: Gfo/Idh/MocA family oxidoreductase [Phycisphaeraceae bacterium]|nr:Gfo/Idh/MocA family oxidoreductase [Phycisphaeraceae bacterium]
MMTQRVIHVGCGGFGEYWCRRFLPLNVQDGLVKVVAAVDVKPDHFRHAREGLGLPAKKCYTDLEKALKENPADVCTIVVPPAFHEAVVDAALKYGLHILSEKPIADTMAASARIAVKARQAGRKMGVTMSHRFDQDKTTLRYLLRRPGPDGPGELDYLVCRFGCDCRKYGAWGNFRHEIADTLLIEGSVHHLDFLMDMTGSRCRTIYAQTWKPRWGEFRGDCQALVTMISESGKRVLYEGTKTNTVGLNPWGQEYIRAECEKSTLILNWRKISSYHYQDHLAGRTADELKNEGEVIPLLQQPKWSNAWLIEKFVRWLEGGEAMETNVWDNLQSVALVFAGIESSRTGRPVEVQEFLRGAVAAAEKELGVA